MLFLVATNGVASQPPERRPTGTPHARANSSPFEGCVMCGPVRVLTSYNLTKIQQTGQYQHNISSYLYAHTKALLIYQPRSEGGTRSLPAKMHHLQN